MHALESVNVRFFIEVFQKKVSITEIPSSLNKHSGSKEIVKNKSSDLTRIFIVIKLSWLHLAFRCFRSQIFFYFPLVFGAATAPNMFAVKARSWIFQFGIIL